MTSRLPRRAEVEYIEFIINLLTACCEDLAVSIHGCRIPFCYGSNTSFCLATVSIFNIRSLSGFSMDSEKKRKSFGTREGTNACQPRSTNVMQANSDEPWVAGRSRGGTAC